MPCRIITSPISGKEVQSKTWNDIYSLVKDEQKADELYDQLTSESFLQWFGDWVNDPNNASKVVNEHGEPLVVYHGTDELFNTFDKSIERHGRTLGEGMYFDSRKDAVERFIGISKLDKEALTERELADYVKPVFLSLKNDKEGTVAGTEYVVKDPNQIKSVFNQGAFSSEDNNIYKSGITDLIYNHDGKPDYSEAAERTTEQSLKQIPASDAALFQFEGKTLDSLELPGVFSILAGPGSGNVTFQPKDEDEEEFIKEYKSYYSASGNADISGRTLRELYDNREQNPRAFSVGLSIYLAQKFSDPNSIFGRIRNHLKKQGLVKDPIRLRFRNVIRTPDTLGFTDGKDIVIFPHLLSFKSRGASLELTLQHAELFLLEELIHDVSIKLLSQREVEDIYKELSEEEKKAIRMFYLKDKKEELQPKNYVHEYVRIMVQDILTGRTTEIPVAKQTPKSAIWKFLNKVFNFLFKNYQAKNESSAIKQAVNRVTDFINGKNIQTGDENNSEITLFSGYDPNFQATEEQKIKQQSIVNSLQEKRDKYGVKKEITKGALDEDEVNRYVRTLNGKTDEPKKRVTDFVRERKTPAQIAKFENASDVKKREWKQKAALGTAFHSQAETIIRHATDSDGYLKPLDQINRRDFERIEGFPSVLSDALYDYLVGDETLPGVLFTAFPKGTMFKVEEIVYDEKRDVAGTIDLIGIDPEGNVHIWDWKTKFLDLEQYDDVPFYSQKDYRIQLDQYKNILSTYGVKREQVKVAQAQPIVFDGIVDQKGNVTLTGAQFPVVDVKQEGRKYLVPVPVEDQSTGNKDLDDFIHQLYRLYDVIYKQPTDNWVGKKEQLNQIAATIRELQIKQNFEPLTVEALTFLGSVDKTIKDVSTLLSGKEAGFNNIQGGEEAFKKHLNSLLLVMKNIDKYVNVHALFSQIYKDEKLTDEQLVTEAKLSDISAKALQHKAAVKQAFEQMMDWFAKTKGVDSILQAEKEISGWIDSDVQSTSRLQTSALNLFYKLESVAKSKRDVAIDTTLKSFKEKLNALREYARQKGIAAANIFTLLTGDKNRWKMVDKIKGEVYEQLDEATDKNIDFLWINKNIDVEGFKKEMEQRLQDKLDQIDEETPEDADEELLAQMKSRKEYYKKHWDTSTHKSLGWFDRETLKKYIKEDLWYTDEYRKIMSEKPVLEMYQWIEEFNRAAFKAGYFDGEWGASLRSLPWVRGSFLDKIGKAGMQAFSDTLKSIYTVHQEEEQQYRQSKDSKLKNIPRPFIHNLGKQEDGSYDLSGISTDIGQTMTLFIQSVLDYQHTKEIESYVEALLLLEENKGHLREQKGSDKLAIDQYGNFITDEGNEQNTKILEEQVNSLIYKQYYDEKTGLPAEATKVVENLNTWIRLKLFAVNLLTPVINTAGGTMQATINSGKLWKGREWALNFMRFMTNKLSGNEGAIRKGLLDYFGLLHSNERGAQVKQMSLQQIHRHSIKDILMGLMRLSDAAIQGVTGLSMLENSMLTSDGRIVNIREYVRHSPEFRKVYDKNIPYAQRKQIEKEFEKKVNELKESSSLIKKAKFNEKGILEIEGLSRDSDAYHAFKNVIKNEIKKITGMMSEDEKRNMERNILWKSMLMFKGWIPRLAEVRFGQIKHNHATDEYEMGRTRLWWDILFRGTEQGRREGNILKGLIQGIKDLGDMRKANDRGLELLHQYYQKVAANYKARTGKELKMTPEDFYQMTREAILMQYKDVTLLLSLLSLFFYVKSTPPPDDPDDRNMRHMVVKALDKLKDEVSFYYNPISAQQIFGGTLIPALGVIGDVQKTVSSSYTEIFGSEQQQQQNYWVKGMMRNFPISQQAASFFLPLLDQQLAKDLGIRVNEESRLNY